MNVFSEIHIEHRKKLLRIFLVELRQLNKLNDRDRFLLNTLHQHLRLDQQAITEVKTEVQKLATDECRPGVVNLQNLMQIIKSEVADQLEKDQAIKLLVALKEIFNVGGHLSDEFLEDLCFQRNQNEDQLKSEKSKPLVAVNAAAFQLTDKNSPISQINIPQKELSSIAQAPKKSSNNSDAAPLNLDIAENRINSTDQKNQLAQSSEQSDSVCLAQTSQSSQSAPKKPESTEKDQSKLKLELIIESLQTALFPVRDAMILRLKVDPRTPIENRIEDRIASIQLRLIALSMDCLVIAVGLFIPAACIVPLSVILQIMQLEVLAVFCTLLPSLAIIAYFVKMEFSNQATLGKLWLGLRICNYNGNTPSRKAMFTRIAFRMTPILLSSVTALSGIIYQPLLGFLFGLTLLSWVAVVLGGGWFLIHIKNQGLHDIIAGTLVLRSSRMPR